RTVWVPPSARETSWRKSPYSKAPGGVSHPQLSSLVQDPGSYASVMRNIVVTVDDIVTTVSERLRPILASMLDGEWPSRVPDEPAPAISLRLTSETRFEVHADADASPEQMDWGSVSYVLF